MLFFDVVVKTTHMPGLGRSLVIALTIKNHVAITGI